MTGPHTEDGGIEFRNGIAWPIESCSACSGKCPTPQACFTPEPDPPKQDKGALIGLAVALLGVLSAFAIVYFRSRNGT